MTTPQICTSEAACLPPHIPQRCCPSDVLFDVSPPSKHLQQKHSRVRHTVLRGMWELLRHPFVPPRRRMPPHHLHAVSRLISSGIHAHRREDYLPFFCGKFGFKRTHSLQTSTGLTLARKRKSNFLIHWLQHRLEPKLKMFLNVLRKVKNKKRHCQSSLHLHVMPWDSQRSL